MAKVHIYGLFFALLLLCGAGRSIAQTRGVNDTIRLGGIVMNGQVYPVVFLDEYTCISKIRNDEDRKRIALLRSRVYAVYPYALAAAAIFKRVNEERDKLDSRRDRKRYLKEVDRQLDAAFKEPLKNMSVEQGHVLISLINRQTGTNCYHVIKDLKGTMSAVMWQGVGVFFNNNLNRDYDPEGRDKELEMVVRELEQSTAYRYQLYLQQELMKKATAVNK